MPRSRKVIREQNRRPPPLLNHPEIAPNLGIQVPIPQSLTPTVHSSEEGSKPGYQPMQVMAFKWPGGTSARGHFTVSAYGMQQGWLLRRMLRHVADRQDWGRQRTVGFWEALPGKLALFIHA